MRRMGFHGIRRLLVLGSLAMIAPMACAGSLLIWPIHPIIESGQPATALWLENRGSEPTVIQLRIFAWQQRDGENQYQQQDAIIGSPPILEIAPGQRQLVRLMRQVPIPPGEEKAWRVILDEISSSDTPQASGGESRAGLNLQMRYSLPLFGYGEGRAAIGGDETSAHALSWRVTEEEGQRFLEVKNRGERHVRLTEVAITQAGHRTTIAQGLLGYVLADSYRRWPLEMAAVGGELTARVNGGEPTRIARLSSSP